MIEAKNLKKIYKPKKGVPVPALDGVSLKLPDKGMVFILGKSGSGKSTLLNVLGGLDMVDSGEIIIKGVSAKDFKQAHYDSYRNTYVGFIFQEYNILEEFSVGANVALAIELQGRKPTEEEINSILKKVDLEGYGNRKPNELSGGQKQRVAIARALVKNPEIIMADEPTGALDSTTGRQVFDTLKSLSKEKLVLIVSHDREFSEQYADRIIELADGKIISDVEKVGEDVAPITEENLTYNANEIEIKKGYVLTESDLKAINEYIASLSDDAKLVIKGEKRPGATKASAEFKATDESAIEIKKDNNFKLIKSKLSLKNAFKIGASGLKHKKVRLVFTIFLSFIAFALFGLADTIASYDNVGTATSSIIDSSVDYASFKKKIDGASWGILLSDADIELIKQGSGIDVMGVYKEMNTEIRFDSHLSTDDAEIEKRLEILFTDRFSGFAEVTENDLARYGYTLLGSSKMPERGKKELAISKYTYQAFAEAGFTYRDPVTNKEITKEINSVDDIIGMVISFDRYGSYTITGVIDTRFDYTRYESLTNTVTDAADMIIQMALQNELSTTQEYSMNCVAFVAPGTIASIKNANNDVGQEFYNFGYMEITNRPLNYQGDDWNKFVGASPSGIARLKDITMPIAWVNGEKSSLADGEFILPVNMVLELMGNNNQNYDFWWDPNYLESFEKELHEDNKGYDIYVNSLTDVLSNYRQIAIVQTIINVDSSSANWDDIVEYVAEKADMSIEDININWDEKTVLYNYIIYAHKDPAFDTITNAYLNDVVSRYKLEGKIINLKERNLYTSVTYNGETHYSYYNEVMSISSFNENYGEIIFNNYIYSNFDKAKAYYLEKHPDAVFTWEEVGMNTDKKFAQFYEIIEEYKKSFYVDTADKFFTNLNNEMSAYVFEKFAPIFLEQINLDGLKTQINLYSPDYVNYEYDFKLVGITPNNDYMSYYAIGSDNIYSMLLGGNADGIYAFAVAPMPDNRADIEKLVKFSYEEFENKVTFGLENAVTHELDMVDELLDVLGQVFLYVGLALAVFASLMLSNFIATSISLKKQEIGILRAIGSRSNDVFRIFFAEAFIIAMINFFLAIVSTGVVAGVINSILRDDIGILITILSFGVRQIGLLLIVSVGVAFISTFLPVKKIASKKPIDAIRKR